MGSLIQNKQFKTLIIKKINIYHYVNVEMINRLIGALIGKQL
jgi:hypothetical protein